MNKNFIDLIGVSIPPVTKQQVVETITSFEAVEVRLKNAVLSVEAACGLMNAVEENYKHCFGEDGSGITMESFALYEHNAKLILKAAGLNVDHKVLSVSFEAEEASEKTGEKKDGFLKAAAKAILTAIQNFFKWIGSLFSKTSENLTEKKKEAEEFAEEVKDKRSKWEESILKSVDESDAKVADAKKTAEEKVKPYKFKHADAKHFHDAIESLNKIVKSITSLGNAIDYNGSNIDGARELLDLSHDGSKDAVTGATLFKTAIAMKQVEVELKNLIEVEKAASEWSNLFGKYADDFTAIEKSLLAEIQKVKFDNPKFDAMKAEDRLKVTETVSNLRNAFIDTGKVAEKAMEDWKSNLMKALSHLSGVSA